MTFNLFKQNMSHYIFWKNLADIPRSRTSWRDRVDTGQLYTTDLTLRISWHGGTSWRQKCHIKTKVPFAAALVLKNTPIIQYGVTLYFLMIAVVNVNKLLFFW